MPKQARDGGALPLEEDLEPQFPGITNIRSGKPHRTARKELRETGFGFCYSSRGGAGVCARLGREGSRPTEQSGGIMYAGCVCNRSRFSNRSTAAGKGILDWSLRTTYRIANACARQKKQQQRSNLWVGSRTPHSRSIPAYREQVLANRSICEAADPESYREATPARGRGPGSALLLGGILQRGPARIGLETSPKKGSVCAEGRRTT